MWPSVPSHCCLVRMWNRYRPRGHPGPLFSYDGTPPHKPTLQWPCSERQQFTPDSVWLRKQTFHKTEPGKFKKKKKPHLICFFNCFVVVFTLHNESLSQGQNSPVFNHKQNHLVQMQSKDMAPRFGKKGKVNADEVQQFASLPRNQSYSLSSALKPTCACCSPVLLALPL